MKRDFDPAAEAPIVASEPVDSRLWRHALAAVALLIVWVLGWYAPTATGMAEIWSRNDTFAHGYVVPPIVLWLVWRIRHELAAVTPRPMWSGLGIVAIAGFVWLMGALANVNALSQLALMSFVVFGIVTVLGTAAARKLAFPLAFLFFAVPVGEFIMPKLMEWTADFTVLGLRLSGVPVFREGQQLVIPTGNWSVVEACSGLRYLVASLMVGTLFAYLTYTSLKRRLLFVGFAILVPIVANWLRAYFIVMLGHLSGNKLAVGVDHLIYGWLFFGVVIAVMLAVGARWREDLDPMKQSLTVAPVAGPRMPVSRLWCAAAAVALVSVIWQFGYRFVERGDSASAAQLATLSVDGGWSATGGAEKWKPHFQFASDELHRGFIKGDQRVGLFVGYYRNQDYRRKLVSSENVLVRSEDPEWARIASQVRDITLSGKTATVYDAELRSTRGRRMAAWQWYWVDGQLTASEHRAKAYTALARLKGRGDDSAVVVVYADEEQPGGARGALGAFVAAAAGEIETALRRTRDQR